MQRIKLYCLASKYCVTPLMERLIDGIHNSIAEHCEFLDLAEINYAYKNCNGACGLTAFISKFVASCKFGRNSHISKETRYKLLREHEGLCLAVSEHINHSNCCVIQSPEATLVEESNCEYQEHWPDEPCVLKDQYPKMTSDQFRNGSI
jgi:hypothetical protein